MSQSMMSLHLRLINLLWWGGQWLPQYSLFPIRSIHFYWTFFTRLIFCTLNFSKILAREILVSLSNFARPPMNRLMIKAWPKEIHSFNWITFEFEAWYLVLNFLYFCSSKDKSVSIKLVWLQKRFELLPRRPAAERLNRDCLF